MEKPITTNQLYTLSKSGIIFNNQSKVMIATCNLDRLTDIEFILNAANCYGELIRLLVEARNLLSESRILSETEDNINIFLQKEGGITDEP